MRLDLILIYIFLFLIHANRSNLLALSSLVPFAYIRAASEFGDAHVPCLDHQRRTTENLPANRRTGSMSAVLAESLGARRRDGLGTGSAQLVGLS